MSLRRVFFFKQKTAYEVRISEWSLDVCSSDLLSSGLVLAGDHRQHWHAGCSVVVRAAQRGRPKVRRCPQEDDQEQRDGFETDLLCHRGPAYCRWKSTSGTADDDFLRQLGRAS